MTNENKCTATSGKIVGMVLVKNPSKYMIKKYGFEEAMKKQIVKSKK